MCNPRLGVLQGCAVEVEYLLGVMDFVTTFTIL